MRNTGLYLMLAGVATILLNLFGFEFRVLMWIDNWGETVGWAIRIGAIVIGAPLFFLGHKADNH